nr:ribokinase [uncultured Anaerostipes sp.]
MKVLNYGSLNYDYVYEVDHINKPGETQSCQARNVFCGGKGLNQSVALARAGVLVYQGGLIGEDGQLFLDICQENGIDTSYLGRTEGPCGHAVIQLDKKGENSIMIYGGANQKQTPEHIAQVLENFGEGDILLLQNEVNGLKDLIDQAWKRQMKIILNPSPWNDVLKECDLKKVSIFLINEVEGEQITGKQKPEEILEEMERFYPDAQTVLTLGSQGAIWQGEGRQIRQEAYPVKTVDTTAAGDTFTGYFIAGLTENIPMEENLNRAARASAIAVSRMGAAPSIPLRREVESWTNF